MNNDVDIFHDVTMSEQTSWKKGYAAGLEEGLNRGYNEGYNLGAEKGTEIGKEVGFYGGYAAHVLNIHLQDGSKNIHLQDSSKARLLKVCEAIIRLSNSFMAIEPSDELLSEYLSKLQGKFKQLTSILGIQVEYNEATANDLRGTSF